MLDVMAHLKTGGIGLNFWIVLPTLQDARGSILIEKMIAQLDIDIKRI